MAGAISHDRQHMRHYGIGKHKLVFNIQMYKSVTIVVNGVLAVILPALDAG